MIKKILPALLIAGFLFSYPASNVIPIPNREYLPMLHKVLTSAKKKIDVFMFEARYYPQYPDDPNAVIVKDLIDAHKRGVKVTVLLDASTWNVSNTIQNKQFGDTLRSAGVDVWYDPPDVTSHDKLIIVDDSVVIVGSTNWSYYALERNNEVSVVIYSKEVAKALEKHFHDVLRLSTREPKMILRRRD